MVRPWAEDADLLAGARRGRPDYLAALLEQLPDDLALQHDIEVVDFDGTNRSHFDVTPAGIPAVRTLRPALVRKGDLLRAGEAREPATVTRE